MITNVLSSADERRLRELAYGMARGIEPGEVLLARLGFTVEDYQQLEETSVFREMLRQATAEWEGASNIQKRLKLKAAVNIEQGLPSMHHAMVNEKEPLAARVKLFDTMARIAGVGMNEGVVGGGGGGPAFRLEINLGRVGGEDQRQIVIDGTPLPPSHDASADSVPGEPALDAQPDEPPAVAPPPARMSSCDELMAGMEDWEEGRG